MASGPVMTLVLEAENAVLRHRDLLGATDPAKAAPQTLRSLFGASIEENAVHGSDSEENALQEIAFFFAGSEIF
jgi:nucleoside-diphosphate kinase